MRGAAHANYLSAYSIEEGPVILSFVRQSPHLYVLFRGKDGNKRLVLNEDDLEVPLLLRCFGFYPHKYILKTINNHIQLPLSDLTYCHDQEGLMSELVKMEERFLTGGFKIGLGYLRAGQNTEAEMFNNSFGKSLVEILSRIRIKS